MKRLPMRKIKEALRLRAEGFSGRRVAQSLTIARATISEYFRRADLAGLSWPLRDDLSDAELEARLYPPLTGQATRQIPQPDWGYVHSELRRKGVTLALLWQEYREVYPDGYGYSQYCARYSSWEGKLSPVMRQRHPAGERLFVDYAGQTVNVICPETGKVRTAQIFIAALGASNYTYVEATWTQSLPDWISSHVRAFDFFGGVPAMIVSDNLKPAVIKACFHDPAINRTYGDMAAHYDTAVVPARPRKPKDKAKVETAVQLAERWILARLRNQTFFGLDELNGAIRPLRDQLNAKVTRHLGASRCALFEDLDKPALRPLPQAPYVYAEWKQRRAGIDDHIDVDRHYYSVPHQLIKRKLWVRITARTVEVFHKGQRVASHARTSGNRQHSTVLEHMPSGHRHRANWTPESIRRSAARIGPNVETYVEVVMRRRKHPEQAYRSCMGVLKLARTFGSERLDAACERALEINSYTYQSLHSILKNGLDRAPQRRTTDEPAITHPNIRGADYFH